MRNRVRVTAAGAIAAAAAVAVVGCSAASGGEKPGGTSSSPAASAPASTTATIKTGAVSGVPVLTNAKGFTLYWFSPDTPTTSKCNGACTSHWPPVTAPATAAAGIAGRFNVITRSDGSAQVTFDGHPLYTFAGDSAPGQAAGNGLDVDGGIWHWAKLSGGSAPASGSSSSSSSGNGGYGY
jgi:predicted lipoprotein with Yx(FWY)xxD motif